MAKSTVQVICWDHGHITQLLINRRQEESLNKKIENGTVGCPECHGRVLLFDGQTVFNRPKIYQCEHGHVTAITAFGKEAFNVRYGPGPEDFFNIDATIDELPEILDEGDVTCYNHTCGAKLVAIDDYVLSRPESAGVKTITRVGDLWDRNKIEPVRPGSYDSDGHYHGTRSEEANRARLKKMRKRNIEEERMPGKRIDKPTETIHERKR